MNLIVAVDSKWGIGRDNGLLASLPTDMKYFKEHTMDKVVVMGRKTLESLPGGRGLPKRVNIVLSSKPCFEAERCTVVHTEEELFKLLERLSEDANGGPSYSSDDVFLIGGGSLYTKLYKCCDKLYVTKIDADLGADTFIPNFDEDEDFEIISRSDPIRENGLTFQFLIYSRKS